MTSVIITLSSLGREVFFLYGDTEEILGSLRLVETAQLRNSVLSLRSRATSALDR